MEDVRVRGYDILASCLEDYTDGPSEVEVLIPQRPFELIIMD
jgi:hypothetical protein